MLSQLPFDIIILILSFLPTKDAARTSTLARRWRILWYYVPVLNFEAKEKFLDPQPTDSVSTETSLEDEEQQYVEWVSQAIDSYMGSNLEPLRVRFSLDSSFQCDVDRWVQFAIQSNLKMFELNLSDTYDSGCSSSLLSSGPKENFPRIMFFNSSPLTTLKLIGVNVGGEALECFLTNCPLLEVLCVKYSNCLVNLRVVGESLKLRQLEICTCNYLKRIEISAPNLESFKYDGHWLRMQLKNTPKLHEVHFASEFGGEIVNRFLMQSSYSSQLQKLVLDLEVDFRENNRHRFWPLFENLKELGLIVIADGHTSLLGFSTLINSCPYLQKFSLKLNYLDVIEEERALGEVRSYIHPHIKVVEFGGFVGKPIDLELVHYFCNNAIFLEEIVFDTRKPKYMGTKFENKQSAETVEGRKLANFLRSNFHSEMKVTII